MAVPKRRTSRSNTHSRRSQWKATPLTLAKCQRGHVISPHTACTDLWPLRRPPGHRRLSRCAPPRSGPRIAVDLLGGDAGPDVVVDGVLDGRPPLARAAAAAGGTAGRGLRPADFAGALSSCWMMRPAGITIVAAMQRIGMDEDPVRAVRARRDATVRVAARLVRDGLADATVIGGLHRRCDGCGAFHARAAPRRHPTAACGGDPGASGAGDPPRRRCHCGGRPGPAVAIRAGRRRICPGASWHRRAVGRAAVCRIRAGEG